MRTVPLSEKFPAVTRVEIDFTTERLEACDSEGGKATSKSAEFFRASYLPGAATVVRHLNRPEGLSFEPCTGDEATRKCDLGLPEGPLGKPMLVVSPRSSASDSWWMEVSPFDQDFPMRNVPFIGPLVAQVAKDKQGNIWFSDGHDNFWMLINDRNVLVEELWGRATPLVQQDEWTKKLPPEVSMNMDKSDIDERRLD
jgi:hypothetical protein